MLRRLELLSVATAGVMMWGGSAAKAQVPYYPVSGNVATINTFDTAASFSTVASYNPPPMIVRFDNGGASPSAHHSIAWSNGSLPGGYDDTASTGGPGAQGTAGDTGGSLKLSQTFHGSSDGSVGSAFTFDVYPGGGDQMVTKISWNLLVDPTSTGVDQYGGYGYFQLFTRDLNYSYTATPAITVNGVLQGGNGYEVGNPTFSAPDKGTWESLSVSFATPVDVRALVFQDYSRNTQNGTFIYNIDNLQMTLANVPEPASLGLLALGLPALLKRRR